MQHLHQTLTQKYQFYSNWHQTKHHNTIHWGVLVVFTFLVFGTILLWTPISFAADTVAPTTPINLTATAISSSQINLSWTASMDDVGVTGYKIYRCSGSGCAPTIQIATSATNSYSNTGLTASTAYTYAVSAYDAAGNESGKSAGVSATTQSGAQTWQQALEQNFDIADTFDNYDDWKGNLQANSFPKYSNSGLLSKLIGDYRYWERYPSNEASIPIAIQDHGSNKRNTGKSFRTSHPGKGPVRGFGEISSTRLFFGAEGDETSGYNSLNLFFRMYLSSTAFPTYAWDDTDHTKPCYTKDAKGYVIPCYVQGKDYAYTDSWKWVAVNVGFINAKDFTEEKRTNNPCRWGLNEIHFHIGGGKTENYEKRVMLQDYETFGGKTGYVDISPFLDKMVGVEIYLKKESASNAGDGEAIVWFYDEAGIPTEVLRVSNVNFMQDETHSDSSCWGAWDELTDPAVNGNQSKIITQAEVDTFKFNRVSLEDNKRIQGTGGAGGNIYLGGVIRNASGNIIGDMETDWYIDDVIINNGRIGPKYFSLLSGTPLPSDITAPSAPTNLTASAVSSSQINLSWTASTDNVGVTGYKIYRCAGSVCAPTIQIATSAINSYSNTGLTASTAYTYAVSAYDAAGNESAKSSSISATTLAGFKPSDLNQDQKVDQLDFDILKQEWKRTDKPASDLNQDGIVDSRDLGIMMSNWEN